MNARKFCLFLHDCRVKVTRDYFTRVCHSRAYANCHHFCRRTDGLKEPMAWVQRVAVEANQPIEALNEALEAVKG